MTKKLIAILLAAVLCAGLLAGCGSTPTSGGNTGAPVSDNPGTSAPAADDGKTYNFVVINHDSSTSMGQHYVETLFNTISEETGGRVTFTYYPGGSLFGATEAIDAVKDGSADICWSITSFFGGVFPISEFINLPANGINSAQMGTEVFQAMIDEIPDCAAEYGDWKVLAHHATSIAPISTVGKKIETPADFKGLQIRAAGTIPTMYINAIGATAISMPTSDVYESLSKGVISGMANDWHNIDCFNLFEPIDYCLDVPVNCVAGFLFMNKDAYASLPEDLQAVFDKYCASGFAADMAGYWWDSCNFWVADKMRENNVEVYEPSQELYDFMFSKDITDSVHQSYINYLNEKGYDGQAVYDQCMAIVARYADKYKGVFDTEFHYDDWDMGSVSNYQG